MSLQVEIATYEKHLAELLKDEGKYVLICADEIAGTFEAYADALKAGYEKYGLKPFLVKRIQAVQQVHFFTRSLEPCHT
jgi:hypothetical protein